MKVIPESMKITEGLNECRWRSGKNDDEKAEVRE